MADAKAEVKVEECFNCPEGEGEVGTQYSKKRGRYIKCNRCGARGPAKHRGGHVEGWNKLMVVLKRMRPRK